MRRLLLFPLLSLVLVAGCGGDEFSPEAAVADAATKTADAGSSKVSFEIEFTGGPQAVTMTGEGAFDYEKQHGTLTYDMGDLLPGGGEVEVVQEGLVLYMRFPPSARQGLPAGKSWVKFDIEALGDQAGVNLGELSQLNQGDPSQMLRYLRGASSGVKKVGEEEVRGVETTRYHANVDLRKSVEQSIDEVPQEMRAGVRASIERVIEMTGTSKVPVDVWIDGEGRARRMAMAYDMAVPGQASKVHLDLNMDFFDFGVEVDVEPPPAGEVIDIATLIRQGQE